MNPTAANAVTTLEFGSSLTISGAGSVLLNQAGNAARITFATGSEIVTQSAGHMIRGRGIIDNGFGSGRFVNHGRLEGNSAAEPLAIFTKLSGDGALKDVAIGGGFVQIFHVLGEAGTTAIVPVEGTYAFGRNSSMIFDLAGTTAGSGYDQLNSTGPITLSSTATVLDISLAGGFVPLPGQTFTLVTTTDSLTGAFGTVKLPAVPLGLSWLKTQTANSYSITLAGSLAADFNDDLRVSNLDLAIWKAGFGAGTTHSQGDADGDGDVDGGDLLVWQRSLGWGIPSVIVSSVVPEPTSIVLAVASCLAGIRRCALADRHRRTSADAIHFGLPRGRFSARRKPSVVIAASDAGGRVLYGGGCTRFVLHPGS